MHNTCLDLTSDTLYDEHDIAIEPELLHTLQQGLSPMVSGRLL